MDDIIEVTTLFIRHNQKYDDLIKKLNLLDLIEFQDVRSKIRETFINVSPLTTSAKRYYQLCEILDKIHLQKECPIVYYIIKLFTLDVEN